MERAGPDDALTEHSAVQSVELTYQIPVLAIATLADLMQYLDSDGERAAALRAYRPAVQAYRAKYGT
jgi:orotate phosphoribosyltransferase